MDPISIVGLVASCVTIAGRLGTLIEATPGLVTSYRETGQSIKRLGNQLRLFQGTVDELQKWLQRSPRVSARVRRNLGASLESCQDVITDIERHVDKVAPGGDAGSLRAGARIRHVWDENAVNQREQRILTQMQMIDIYIRALHLNDPEDQESILDTASTIALIERSNDDARTIRSEWFGDSETIASTASPIQQQQQQRQRQRPGPAVQSGRRNSVLKMFRNLTLSQKARHQLADELTRACQNRNMTLVHELIRRGASPNEPTSDYRIPFIEAISIGQFTMVKTLLDYGAKPDLRWRHLENESGVISAAITPLTVAIETRNAIITRLLIKYGAQVITKDRHIESLLFPAIKSGEPEIITALLAAGADCEVNTPSPYDDISPLEASIDQGSVAIARTLLDYGAEIAQSRGQWPLICRAVLRGQNVDDFVRELVDRGADVNGRCDRAKLQHVRHYGGRPRFEEDYVKSVSAVMLLARKTGNRRALEFLLRNGANASAGMVYVDDFDREVGSPLHDAADDEVVSLLLKHGAKINEQTAYHETPLARALLHRRHRTAVALLNAGAEVNIQGWLERPELDYFQESFPSEKTTAEDASRFKDPLERYTFREPAQTSFLKVLAYLLAAGADPNQRTEPIEEHMNVMRAPMYTMDWKSGGKTPKPFLAKCDSLMDEAARTAPAVRRARFLGGETVLGVNRHSPIGSEVEQVCYEWIEKGKLNI